MSRTALCTDSSALLPVELAERLDVIVVPVTVALDGEPFADPERRVDEFYDLLEAGATASTAHPSPGGFVEAYARAAGRGADEVLSLHLDARTSGTVRAAELAAADAPLRVTVLDTRTVSYGVGLCVGRAAEAIAAGASAGEAAAAAGALGASLSTVFVARSSPGGRVPDQGGWTVLTLVDGAVAPVEQAHSVDAAVAVLAERVTARDGTVCAAVGHAGRALEPAAEALLAALERSADVGGVERYRVLPAVGAHTGPSSLGAFWWPAPTRQRRSR
jgi:DegV family protein with EDD domain